MSQEAEPFYVFLSEVATIATLADKIVTDRKSAEAFKGHHQVRDAITRLRSKFPDWIEKEKDVAASDSNVN